MFRYYLTQRPPMPGTFPKNAANVVSFDDRKEIRNLAKKTWGYVEYDTPLDLQQMREYELREAGPFYTSLETGEMLSRQAMLYQWSELYDGGDPTNPVGWDEHYAEVC